MRIDVRPVAPGMVSRRARVVADELPDPAAPVVLQVSRWDRLKDMVGVMKRRPVVGGRVGGIVDQIVDGSGYLVQPTDMEEFGAAVNRLLSDPPAARRMGKAARDHVHRAYFGDTHLLRWAELFGSLVDRRAAS